ncbi:sensor domain-containing diguanylate cyclase [Ruminococcaceae bacterium OttesenSCG-928-I18]|nr:sensor domain-containing diguanylate cyclase [Ruminococcaceae bacterium OttesenSCG-928-I18]
MKRELWHEYIELLDRLEQPVVVSDLATHRMLYMNGAAKQHFLSSEYQEKSCFHVLAGLASPCSNCKNGILQEDTYRVGLDDGCSVKTSRSKAFHKKVRWQGKQARFSLFPGRDPVSESEVDKAIVGCVRSLMGSKSLGESIQTILHAVLEYHGADRAYVFELDETGEKASNTYEVCAEGMSPEIDEFQMVPFKESTSQWYSLLMQGEPVIVSEVDLLAKDLPREHSVMQDWDASTLILAPILGTDKIIGYYGVDNPRRAKTDATLLMYLSLFIAKEVTERKLYEALTELSYRDRFTGLYNRNRYLEDIEKRNGNGLPCGVVFIDINDLKSTNDQKGHEYGDKVIRQVTGAIAPCFEGDAYRVGGDEFVVICPGISEKNLARCVESYKERCQKMGCSISVGLSHSTHLGDLYELIKKADNAMYAEKALYYLQHGRDRRRGG